MRFLTPVAIALGCCLVSFVKAQDLKPAELVAMKKFQLAQIDSLVRAKGFRKSNSTEESSFSTYMYAYRDVNGPVPVQRNLRVGLRKTIHVLSLEYGVWSKAEAALFIDQLTGEGFKKVVRSLPGPGGDLQTVSYKRGPDAFTYEESDQSGARLYRFSTETENYSDR